MSNFRNRTMMIETHQFSGSREAVVRCFSTGKASHPSDEIVALCLFAPGEFGVQLRTWISHVPKQLEHERVFNSLTAANEFAAQQADILQMSPYAYWGTSSDTHDAQILTK